MLDIKNVSSCRPSLRSSSWSWVFLRCHERSVQLEPTLGGERERDRDVGEFAQRKTRLGPSVHNLLNINRRWVREDLRSNRGQCFQNSL